MADPVLSVYEEAVEVERLRREVLALNRHLAEVRVYRRSTAVLPTTVGLRRGFIEHNVAGAIAFKAQNPQLCLFGCDRVIPRHPSLRGYIGRVILKEITNPFSFPLAIRTVGMGPATEVVVPRTAHNVAVVPYSGIAIECAFAPHEPCTGEEVDGWMVVDSTFLAILKRFTQCDERKMVDGKTLAVPVAAVERYNAWVAESKRKAAPLVTLSEVGITIEVLPDWSIMDSSGDWAGTAEAAEQKRVYREGATVHFEAQVIVYIRYNHHL